MEVLRQKHRSGFEIIMDILNKIQEQDGCKISYLGTTCNLSHYALKNRLEELKKQDYVFLEKKTLRQRLDKTKEYAVQVFKLTPKGQQFLVDMNRYREVISSLCL